MMSIMSSNDFKTFGSQIASHSKRNFGSRIKFLKLLYKFLTLGQLSIHNKNRSTIYRSNYEVSKKCVCILVSNDLDDGDACKIKQK